MEKHKSSVFIATPMYGGMCTAGYTQSIIGLQHALLMRNYGIGYSYVQNESLITRARNNLVYQFLQSDCDYLLFIDADHRFDPLGIIRMLEEDEDVLCAIAPKKTINWNTVMEAHDEGMQNLDFFTGNFVINTTADAVVSATEKFEIEHGGTGIMLIKRRVFELMEPHCSWYYKNIDEDDFVNKKRIVEFFTTTIKDETLLSEDFNFCLKWRELDGKVYAAPWVRMTHIGTYEFRGSWNAFIDLKARQAGLKT